MKIIVIVLACISFIYTIYSLIGLLIKINKSEKKKWIFKATLFQWLVHGSGILLLISATIIYSRKQSEACLLFFCLLFNAVVDFVIRNIIVMR